MSARKPTIANGLVVALVLSLSGAAVLAALAPWLGHATAARAVIALAGFAYVLVTMSQSGERVGRVTTVVCWCVAAGAASLADVSLTAYALLHVGLVALARSLYHRSGVLPALVDLGLGLLGAAFAAWALQRSGSPGLALWCFFLAQAFHVLIPASLGGARGGADTVEDGFARAQRDAEAAVRRLSSNAR